MFAGLLATFSPKDYRPATCPPPPRAPRRSTFPPSLVPFTWKLQAYLVCFYDYRSPEGIPLLQLHVSPQTTFRRACIYLPLSARLGAASGENNEGFSRNQQQGELKNLTTATFCKWLKCDDTGMSRLPVMTAVQNDVARSHDSCDHY